MLLPPHFPATSLARATIPKSSTTASSPFARNAKRQISYKEWWKGKTLLPCIWLLLIGFREPNLLAQPWALATQVTSGLGGLVRGWRYFDIFPNMSASKIRNVPYSSYRRSASHKRVCILVHFSVHICGRFLIHPEWRFFASTSSHMNWFVTLIGTTIRWY